MKLTTFLLVLLAMVSAFAFVTWQRLSIDLEEDLSNHATDINSKAPIVLDPYTDIIGARTEGKEIVYLYRVHGLSAETMVRNVGVLRDNKIAVAREDANISRLLESGARLTHEYFVGNDLALKFSIEKASLGG